MAKLTLARAKEILKKTTTEEHLFKHAAAVSAAMGAMAEHFGADKDYWAAVGYLHDVDYEKFPEEHCHHVRELLADEDVDEEAVRAIISHGYGLTGVDEQPESDMEKSLYTVDELTGIVEAYALMRPEHFTGMTVKSFKKKFKDKRFAAGCNRDVIKQGFTMLGMELADVMALTIKGMSEHQAELGF